MSSFNFNNLQYINEAKGPIHKAGNCMRLKVSLNNQIRLLARARAKNNPEGVKATQIKINNLKVKIRDAGC